MPTAWIADAGLSDRGLGAGIAGLLARAQIETHMLVEPDPSPLGVLAFGVVDDALLALLRRHRSSAAVLALSCSPTALPSAALWSLIEAGARDVLHWPRLPETADDVAVRLQRWSATDALLDSGRVRAALVGASASWRQVMRGVVDAAAFTASSVLVTGETGTGKELIARLIHDLDPRLDKGEFVIVDCTTLSPELSGSELFGHERGAFTGAQSAREGAFALAHKGTLFLDEVGELSLDLQARLLRVVQEHAYKRVGGNAWQHTDFRLVSATHRDLPRSVADGSFRADFYHRIAGWQCRSVPLRERKDDVLPLARHFIREALQQAGDVDLDPAVREFLVSRDYPGNVRDLRQLVARICHRHCGSGAITVGAIAPEDVGPGTTPAGLWPESSFRAAVRAAVDAGIGMKDIGQRATELAIEMALECEGGNLQRAAARLGVTDRALQIRRASQRGAL